jgi:hypothetical protein
LQRKCACGGTPGGSGECAECEKKKRNLQGKANGQGAPGANHSLSHIPVMQPKLTLGASNDPLEQEADRVADQVLAAPAHPAVGGAPPHIQRFSGQPIRQAETAPASIDRVLSDTGRPLEPALRQGMEHRFGHDFSRVRVHSGTAAEKSARDVNANAYTVGHNIVFGAGRFAPGTREGRRLIAHELTHVVQQSGSDEIRVGQSNEKRGLPPTAAMVQRDLATPPPAPPAAAQPDLTDPEIDQAIKFNRVRYDAASTRLIQDIVGTEPTGTWVKDDILAIASIQEQYGLRKDGMVGPRFFRFLDEEVRRENLSRADEHCLLAFRAISSPQTVGPVVGGVRAITGQFSVHAQFSRHCGCAAYEYRQFIRGHWRRERAGVVADLGDTFARQPAGRLNEAFDEDGNNTAAALNYGHRAQPAEAINHYLDDTGAVDQADGCNYESEDAPGGPDAVLPGDVFDVNVNFRGEIQRNGRVVRTLHWTAIRGRFPVL